MLMHIGNELAGIAEITNRIYYKFAVEKSTKNNKKNT